MRRLAEFLWECRWPIAIAVLLCTLSHALLRSYEANRAYNDLAWGVLP